MEILCFQGQQAYAQLAEKYACSAKTIKRKSNSSYSVKKEAKISRKVVVFKVIGTAKILIKGRCIITNALISTFCIAFCIIIDRLLPSRTYLRLYSYIKSFLSGLRILYFYSTKKFLWQLALYVKKYKEANTLLYVYKGTPCSQKQGVPI